MLKMNRYLHLYISLQDILYFMLKYIRIKYKIFCELFDNFILILLYAE